MCWWPYVTAFVRPRLHHEDMATTRYTRHFNAAALRAVLLSPTGGLARDLMRRGLNVESQAKRNLAGGPSGPKRIDTGRLRSSVNTKLVIRDDSMAALIGTNVWYAILVHDGTGVHGPRRQPIRPRTATRLRFRPQGSRKYVYAKQVAGMAPNRFLADALKVASR